MDVVLIVVKDGGEVEQTAVVQICFFLFFLGFVGKAQAWLLLLVVLDFLVSVRYLDSMGFCRDVPRSEVFGVSFAFHSVYPGSQDLHFELDVHRYFDWNVVLVKLTLSLMISSV